MWLGVGRILLCKFYFLFFNSILKGPNKKKYISPISYLLLIKPDNVREKDKLCAENKYINTLRNY